MRVALLGDPSRSLGALAEPECRRINARAGPRRADAGSGRVVHGLLRRTDLDEQRHREHGLDQRRAAPHHRVHPGRRRDERRRHRDQRRGPAVLEQRSHDADAHPRNPHHAAGKHDGADRKDIAGLLRRRLGRGQPRHRRLRAGDGARTVRASTTRATCKDACSLLLRHYGYTYVMPGERFPRRLPTDDPATRDVRESPHAHIDGVSFTTVGEIFSSEHNADRKKPFDIRSVMRAASDSRLPAAGTLVALAQRRDGRRVGRPNRRDSGVPAGDRVAAAAPRRLRPGGRPAGLHAGHAVPAVVAQGCPGGQRRQRQPAARRAGEPFRLRRLTGVDAGLAAGVRRGDRPCRHELPGPDRLRGHLALPRRRVRGVLQDAERLRSKWLRWRARTPRSSAALRPRRSSSPET